MPRLVPLLLISLCLSGCAYVNVPLVTRPMALEEQLLEGEGRPKIVVLDLAGFISEREKQTGMLARGAPSSVAHLKEALQMAESDDEVAGVVLRINSPGGTVTASDTIHHEIIRFRERKKVPFIACITGIGASGGYYVATAADEIVAHPAAITGSIGVMLMKFNVEGLLAKIGVSESTVKSGKKKDLLSPFRAATSDEENLVQNIINRLHERFVGVILTRPKNRLKQQEVLEIADGSIFTADQARDAGLIDRIGYMDEALEELKRTLGVDKARVVTYYRPGSFKGSIYSEAPDGTATALLPETFWSDVEPAMHGGFLYLWNP